MCVSPARLERCASTANGRHRFHRSAQANVATLASAPLLALVRWSTVGIRRCTARCDTIFICQEAAARRRRRRRSLVVVADGVSTFPRQLNKLGGFSLSDRRKEIFFSDWLHSNKNPSVDPIFCFFLLKLTKVDNEMSSEYERHCTTTWRCHNK